MFLTGPKEKKVCVCVSERERDWTKEKMVYVYVRDWTKKTGGVCVCV